MVHLACAILLIVANVASAARQHASGFVHRLSTEGAPKITNDNKWVCVVNFEAKDNFGAALRVFNGTHWQVKPDEGIHIGFINTAKTVWIPKENIVHRNAQGDSCADAAVLGAQEGGRGIEALEESQIEDETTAQTEDGTEETPTDVPAEASAETPSKDEVLPVRVDTAAVVQEYLRCRRANDVTCLSQTLSDDAFMKVVKPAILGGTEEHKGIAAFQEYVRKNPFVAKNVRNERILPEVVAVDGGGSKQTYLFETYKVFTWHSMQAEIFVSAKGKITGVFVQKEQPSPGKEETASEAPAETPTKDPKDQTPPKGATPTADPTQGENSLAWRWGLCVPAVIVAVMAVVRAVAPFDP